MLLLPVACQSQISHASMKPISRCFPFLLSGVSGALMTFVLLWFGNRVGFARMFTPEDTTHAAIMVGGPLLLLASLLARWNPRSMAMATIAFLMILIVLIASRFISLPIEHWASSWKMASAALLFSANVFWLYRTHLQRAKRTRA
jgi:hypothetical protein